MTADPSARLAQAEADLRSAHTTFDPLIGGPRNAAFVEAGNRCYVAAERVRDLKERAS